MSTLLQRDLAEAIIKNRSLPKYKRKNKKELLVSTGYAIKTAQTEATPIIESKGVQKALRDIMNEAGLTEELITKSLVYDIENKPKRRVKELGLGAEILGMKKQEPHGNTNILNIYASEQATRIARRILNDQSESQGTFN